MAFDCGDAQFLLCRLSCFGLNKQLLQVIQSWLRDRSDSVIVSCKENEFHKLAQDGLLRSGLWTKFIERFVVW